MGRRENEQEAFGTHTHTRALSLSLSLSLSHTYTYTCTHIHTNTKTVHNSLVSLPRVNEFLPSPSLLDPSCPRPALPGPCLSALLRTRQPWLNRCVMLPTDYARDKTKMGANEKWHILLLLLVSRAMSEGCPFRKRRMKQRVGQAYAAGLGQRWCWHLLS